MFLRTDQLISSVRIEILFDLLALAEFPFPRVSFRWLRESRRLISSLLDVTGETLLGLAADFFVGTRKLLSCLLEVVNSFRWSVSA